MANLTVGNKSSVEQYVSANGTITHSHTVAAGTNRILLVATSLQEVTATPTISGITYNGSALTAVPSSEQNTGVTWDRVQWWYLVGPSTGANNLVLTISGAGEDANITMDVADYSNHNGAAPTGGFKSSGSSVTSLNTGAIAYTDGDVIGAATVHGINGKTVTWTNATEYSDNDFQAQHQSTAFYTAAGSGNITITATPSATEGRMALSAVRISPATVANSITSVSQIYPGGLVTVVLSGYASAPLTANCTLNGVGITLEAGATTTGCTFYAPAESTYLYGGARASHRFNTNCTLTIANGTDTANSTVRVTPQSSDQLAARSADALVNPIDSYNGGLTVATNDDVYQYSDPVDAFTPYPATNDFTALEPAFNLYTKFYDVSASSWSSLTTTVFPTAAPPGGGTLSMTQAEVALNPPGTSLPADVNLTSFGNADWLHTARLTTETYDSKSGGTMIGAPANIGTPAWARGEGDSLGHPLMTWTGGDPLATGTGYRFYDYTSVSGAGKRFTISPAGALVKLYFWASAYNGAGTVTVSFSDSSADPVTHTNTTGTNIHRLYRYEITAQPVDGGATIQVDFTNVSGLIGWQAIAVETGTPEANYSLTVSDTTVTPGQTVTLTLVGGPFQGAITDVLLVYGAVEVAVDYVVVNSSTVTFTTPELFKYAPDQLAEGLPWYGNFTVRIMAGNESADSPNTNQVVAPTPGDYGTVAAPPWSAGYPAAAQEGDGCYGYVQVGAGTLTPETFGFSQSEPSIYRWMVFNVASGLWLAPKVISTFTSPTSETTLVMQAIRRFLRRLVKRIVK